MRRCVYLDACACETCACILYIGEKQDAVVKQRLVGVEKKKATPSGGYGQEYAGN